MILSVDYTDYADFGFKALPVYVDKNVVCRARSFCRRLTALQTFNRNLRNLRIINVLRLAYSR
ncbi:MAG: hypothetical protein JOZ08_02200 [Verrucomicrobia bacterium]|nr:hypothetical protein [Verrucomicrobiota bacterium]